MEVNSKDYWNSRFSTDWVANMGKEQSAFFARIALASFPEWLTASILREGLTICDWGCALGDGTHEISNAFPKNVLTGIDFSTTAIEIATGSYPGLRFIASDLLKKTHQDRYDVIFS